MTTDPRLDLAVGVLDLHGGRVRFVHPREPTALLDDEDVAADQAYPPYWAEVWESGVELAHAVSARPWTGASVLELGCGLGLPSLAAALAGARVLATDRAADALAFTGASIAVQLAGELERSRNRGSFRWTEARPDLVEPGGQRLGCAGFRSGVEDCDHVLLSGSSAQS